jgi:hypothetical protein
MEFILGVLVGVMFVFAFINVAAEKRAKSIEKFEVKPLFDEEYYENQRLIRESIKQQQKLIAEMIELLKKKELKFETSTR